MVNFSLQNWNTTMKSKILSIFLIASSVARRKASVLSMAVASYVTDKGILWGQMAAMSIIMILPMIMFALFVQRYLVKGIMLGAVIK